MKRLLLSFVVVSAASCVDPAVLRGFECDADGRCVVVDAGMSVTGGGSSTGGGSATGGGSVTGGGSATGGGGGGGATCNSSSCTGCCDEDGACRNGDEATACGQSGVACTSCGAEARCVQSVCQPLSITGDACFSNAECLSNSCVGGVCCNSACTGSCETCNATGTAGTCSPLPEASVITACGAYACDGVSGSCPTSCTTSRQCATGNYCASGTCQPLKAKGDVCTSSSQCVTNFCADGVCCDGACSGSCDRCNLTGSNGTCTPAPASDPGSPVCGGSIVCNGTLVDCPITCTSGCPSTTFCSGTYCSAKKANGVACGAAGECQSAFCADGVCCESACGGDCDACSVALGSSADGMCSLLGPSRVCRGAAPQCDREERCTGTSATCPGNVFVDAGVSCGTTMLSPWTGCDAGAECGTTGVQTRTRTTQSCTGTSTACGSSSTSESQSCSRPSDGLSCGAPTFGNWSGCDWQDACDVAATDSRLRTDLRCASGACNGSQTTETQACNRTTENASCGTGTPTYSAWSACDYPVNSCNQTMLSTRTRTDPVCQSAACGSRTVLEQDSTRCTRSTNGSSCGATDTGPWSACSYVPGCSLTGTRTRTVTTSSCGSGACVPTSVTETDTSGFCTRGNPPGACQPTVNGPVTGCSYGDVCTNSGTGTQTVTTYACNAGLCQGTTVNQGAACSRNTNGTECRGSGGICDVVELCSNGVCPADAVQPTTVVCAEADEFSCLNAARCNGGKTCPSQTRTCPIARCCGDGRCSLNCDGPIP